MTFEEFDAALQKLRDNQIVQGELLGRLERVVDRHGEAILQHEEVLARHGRAIESLANGMVTLQSVMTRMVDAIQETQGNIRELTEGQKVMQTSMDHLFKRMDRFIRGLESNGHERR